MCVRWVGVGGWGYSSVRVCKCVCVRKVRVWIRFGVQGKLACEVRLGNICVCVYAHEYKLY